MTTESEDVISKERVGIFNCFFSFLITSESEAKLVKMLIVFLFAEKDFAEKDFAERIFPPHPQFCGVFRGENLFSTKLFSAKSIQTKMFACKKPVIFVKSPC